MRVNQLKVYLIFVLNEQNTFFLSKPTLKETLRWNLFVSSDYFSPREPDQIFFMFIHNKFMF